MLEIIDPSDWIKNTLSVVKTENMPHRVAMSFFDEYYNNQSVGIQAFSLGTSDPTLVNEDFLFAIQNAILNIMENSVRKNSKIKNISILSVHEDMQVALVILQAMMKIPAFVNLQVVAAIATDNKKWIDVLLARTGDVDLEKLTVFEMRNLVEDEDLKVHEISDSIDDLDDFPYDENYGEYEDGDAEEKP